MNPYYLWIEGKQAGPYTIGQLHGMWNAGAITAQTPHWREGMKAWEPLGMVVETTAKTGEKLDDWTNFQFLLLVIGSMLIPLIGLLVGLLALGNPLKRQRGLFLVGVSVLFCFLGYLLFSA